MSRALFGLLGLVIMFTLMIGILPGCGEVPKTATWHDMVKLLWASLGDVWGTSADNLYVVGYSICGEEHGVVYHYDGKTWSKTIIPVEGRLRGIWGTSANNVFAVGYTSKEPVHSIIVHYDGNGWAQMSSPSYDILRAVWGSSAKDVFAVGSFGTILHYDGIGWHEEDVPGRVYAHLLDVWGTSHSDVFAVGDKGTILHYDGIDWKEMDIPQDVTKPSLGGVWGSSSSDVYAVGGGNILHYDGVSWREVSGVASYGLSSIWGSSSNDVFAAGSKMLHYDGTAWAEMDIGNCSFNLNTVWGLESTDVFAIGIGSCILHYATRNDVANTPVGPNVRIDFTGVVVSFGNVTKEGTTTIDSGNCTYSAVPSSIQVRGLSHGIRTTATYSGFLTVGLEYDESQVINEGKLQLLYWAPSFYTGEHFKDGTTSIDTVNNIIYGQVSEGVPFFVGEKL